MQKQLEELSKNILFFEGEYNESFEDFLQDVSNTVEGHDDWIEWTYLMNIANELSNKMTSLAF